MLDGEIAYREGRFDDAFATCGARSSSTTRCPTTSRGAGCSRPGTRYGALLLEQGRVEEAAAVYAADLGFDPTLSRPCQHPGNVWSLHGYHECLQRLGRTDEAAIIGQQLELAPGARGRADPGVVRMPARGRRALSLSFIRRRLAPARSRRASRHRSRPHR